VKELDWDKDIKEFIEQQYMNQWLFYGQRHFTKKIEDFLNENGSSTWGDILNLSLAGTLLYSGMAPFSAFTFISLNILKSTLNSISKNIKKKIKSDEIRGYVDSIFDAQLNDFRKGKSVKLVSEIKKGLNKKYGGVFMTTAEVKDCIVLSNAQIINPSNIEKSIDDCFKK
jgi:hypothetical protein